MDPTGQYRRERSNSPNANKELQDHPTMKQEASRYYSKHKQQNPLTEVGLINEYIDQYVVPKKLVEITVDEYDEKIIGYNKLLEENQQLRLEIETMILVNTQPVSNAQQPKTKNAKVQIRGLTSRSDSLDSVEQNLITGKPIMELPLQVIDYLKLSKEKNLGEYQKKIDDVKEEWRLALRNMGNLSSDQIIYNPAAENYLGQSLRMQKLPSRWKPSPSNVKRQLGMELLNKTLMSHVFGKSKMGSSQQSSRSSKENFFVPQFDIRYKLLDMNDPQNLRDYLRFLGHPNLPYQDILEEISLTYLRKILGKYKNEHRDIQDDLVDKNNRLKQQLLDQGISPNEQYTSYGRKRGSNTRKQTHANSRTSRRNSQSIVPIMGETANSLKTSQEESTPLTTTIQNSGRLTRQNDREAASNMQQEFKLSLKKVQD